MASIPSISMPWRGQPHDPIGAAKGVTDIENTRSVMAERAQRMRHAEAMQPHQIAGAIASTQGKHLSNLRSRQAIQHEQEVFPLRLENEMLKGEAERVNLLRSANSIASTRADIAASRAAAEEEASGQRWFDEYRGKVKQTKSKEELDQLAIMTNNFYGASSNQKAELDKLVIAQQKVINNSIFGKAQQEKETRITAAIRDGFLDINDRDNPQAVSRALREKAKKGIKFKLFEKGIKEWPKVDGIDPNTGLPALVDMPVDDLLKPNGDIDGDALTMFIASIQPIQPIGMGSKGDGSKGDGSRKPKSPAELNEIYDKALQARIKHFENLWGPRYKNVDGEYKLQWSQKKNEQAKREAQDAGNNARRAAEQDFNLLRFNDRSHARAYASQQGFTSFTYQVPSATANDWETVTENLQASGGGRASGLGQRLLSLLGQPSNNFLAQNSAGTPAASQQSTVPLAKRTWHIGEEPFTDAQYHVWQQVLSDNPGMDKKDAARKVLKDWESAGGDPTVAPPLRPNASSPSATPPPTGIAMPPSSPYMPTHDPMGWRASDRVAVRDGRISELKAIIERMEGYSEEQKTRMTDPKTYERTLKQHKKELAALEEERSKEIPRTSLRDRRRQPRGPRLSGRQ